MKIIKNIQKVLIVGVLIGQLLCTGVYFPIINFMPAYLVLLVLLGLVTICKQLFFSSEKPSITGWFGISFLLLANILIVMLGTGRFAYDRFLLILFSFTFALSCYSIIKDEEDMKFLLKTYVIIIFISCIVAIGQYLNIEFFTMIWKRLHVEDTITSALGSERYLGLAANALQFGYYASAAYIVALFYKVENKKDIVAKWLIVAVMIVAILANNTRSAIITVLISTLIYAWKSMRLKALEKVFVLILILVVFALLLGVFEINILEGSRFGEQTTDTMARIPMVLTAFNHAMRYPFGMGVYTVKENLIVGASAGEYALVLKNTAHNLFGNCVASYGFIGLVLMILLYVKAFSDYGKTNKNYISQIALYCLIGLMVNAFFHNSYILNGEISSFLFFGILAASAKFKVKEEKK